MAVQLLEGPGSVDTVIVSSCGVAWPRGFPVQHGRDDDDATTGVIYHHRPPIQWMCRVVEVDGGLAYVCETSGAWALHDPILDEAAE